MYERNNDVIWFGHDLCLLRIFLFFIFFEQTILLTYEPLNDNASFCLKEASV